MNAAAPYAPASAPAYTSSFPSYNSDNDFAPSSLSSSSSSTSSLLIRALLVIILLALIGFNVFAYLGDITQWFSDTFGAPFREVARFLGYAASDTVKTTVNVAAQGAKSSVDIAAGAATSGIDVLEKTIGSGNTLNQVADGTQAARGTQDDASKESSLDAALSHAKKKPPQPDEASSRIQRSAGKSGYCYIGEDRGFRSCIKVGEQDTCMSGDIFPTHAICINPRLRK